MIILPPGAIEPKEDAQGSVEPGDIVLYRIPDSKSGKTRLRPALVVTTQGQGKGFTATLLVTLDMFRDSDLDPSMMQHGYQLILIAIGQGAVEACKEGEGPGTWRMRKPPKPTEGEG